MNYSRLVLALACLFLTVDATLILGTAGTVGVGTAYAGAALAGVFGLAVGAGLVGLLAAGGRRRGKRDVEIQQKTDMVLDMVAAADVYGCALKLVCLVESKPGDQLSAEDKLILTIFGDKPAPVDVSEVNKSARKAYFYAAYMGDSLGKDSCEEIFTECDASYDFMMSYVRALNI